MIQNCVSCQKDFENEGVYFDNDGVCEFCLELNKDEVALCREYNAMVQERHSWERRREGHYL
jgi:hypothetical protein